MQPKIENIGRVLLFFANEGMLAQACIPQVKPPFHFNKANVDQPSAVMKTSRGLCFPISSPKVAGVYFERYVVQQGSVAEFVEGNVIIVTSDDLKRK